MKLSGQTRYYQFNEKGHRVRVDADVAKTGVNTFFVGGVNPKTTGTTSDDDIIAKNYYVVDIDIRSAIREKEKRKITQGELIGEIEIIKARLDDSGTHGCWTHIVCTGNGVHIYYIGDDAPLDKYSIGVSKVFENFDSEILGGTVYNADTSMKNLSRLARVPGSVNSKPNKDWYMGDQKCEVLYKEERNSWTLTCIADFYEEREKDMQRKISEYNTTKKNYKSDSENVYELIEKLDCSELFCNNTKLEKARDGKNFISDKDGHFISGFYLEQENLICFSDVSSRHNTHGIPVYGPYTYIKYEILNGCDDAEIFKWAESNYPHIERQAIENRKNYSGIDKRRVEQIIEDTKSDGPMFKNLGYLYPPGPFNKNFGGFKSGECVMVSAGSNQGKTSFVLQILKTNKLLEKKVSIINMEFDLDDGFKYEYYRARGFKDQEVKLKGTDLDPITTPEKSALDNYISKRRNEVNIIDMNQGIPLEEILEKCYELGKAGVSMIAIDSLSSIGEASSDFKYQNKLIQKFRDFCTNTGIVIILIHHFNKKGEEYSGSGKLRDLSNVTIEMFPEQDTFGEYFRRFELSKDKPHNKKIVCRCYYENGEYNEVPKEMVLDKK